MKRGDYYDTMRQPLTLACLFCVLLCTATGCVTNKFKVVDDSRQLAEGRRVVTVVTCTKAEPIYQRSFRDEYLSEGIMPPHIRWTANFHVDRVLQGNLAAETITLVDARDVGEPYSAFVFEKGKTYTIGFNSVSRQRIKDCVVLGTVPHGGPPIHEPF